MEAERLWKRAADELLSRSGAGGLGKWLTDSRVLEIVDRVLLVAVATGRARSVLERRRGALLGILAEQGANLSDVRFLVSAPLVRSGGGGGARQESLFGRHPRFRSRYSFETYVVGLSNRMAVRACEAVAAKPGQVYNPLFLYGPSGIGKTHLLHAIGRRVETHLPGLRVVYVSAHAFTEELIRAIQGGVSDAFQEHYNSAQVLMVDDVQEFDGTASAQEALFHAFNELHMADRQIILASDRLPRQMSSLEERLLSRFGWGLVVDIAPPDFEERVAIVMAKAAERGVAIPPPVVEYLARRLPGSVRLLEGAVTDLAARSQVAGSAPDLSMATRVLAHFQRLPDRLLAPAAVAELVASFCGVDVGLMVGRAKGKKVEEARRVAMYIARHECGASFGEVGRVFGGRDHSTVLYACVRMRRGMEERPELRELVAEILAVVRSPGGASMRRTAG